MLPGGHVHPVLVERSQILSARFEQLRQRQNQGGYQHAALIVHSHRKTPCVLVLMNGGGPFPHQHVAFSLLIRVPSAMLRCAQLSKLELSHIGDSHARMLQAPHSADLISRVAYNHARSTYWLYIDSYSLARSLSLHTSFSASKIRQFAHQPSNPSPPARVSPVPSIKFGPRSS
jgi:hypothetical protein